MPVTTMTSKDNENLPNVQIVTDYPGAETKYVFHDYHCPRDGQHLDIELSPECLPHDPDNGKWGCRFREPLYMMTKYAGCVLDTRERNGYDDSDFYASVWDEESQSVKEIQYATTRGWTYPNSATVDATPEVKAKAEAWYRAGRLEAWNRENAEQARYPMVGRTVKVVRGRKIPKGVVAKVTWLGDDQWKAAQHRRYRNPMAEAMGFHKYEVGDKRVKLNWSDDKGPLNEFTAATNVEVVNPDQYLWPESDFR